MWGDATAMTDPSRNASPDPMMVAVNASRARRDPHVSGAPLPTAPVTE